MSSAIDLHFNNQISFFDWSRHEQIIYSKGYTSSERVQYIQNKYKESFPLLKFNIIKKSIDRLLTNRPIYHIAIYRQEIGIAAYRNINEITDIVDSLWGNDLIPPPKDLEIITQENLKKFNRRHEELNRRGLKEKLQRRFEVAQQYAQCTDNESWNRQLIDPVEIPDEDKDHSSSKSDSWSVDKEIAEPDYTLTPVISIDASPHQGSEFSTRTISASTGSTQGNREYMEDRASSQNLVIKERRIPLFGVFDGHAGVHIADNLNQLFPIILEKGLKSALKSTHQSKRDIALFQLLKTIFVELGEHIRIQSNLPNQRDGSTAVSAMIIDEKLWVANVGDSGAILSRRGKPICLTIPAKIQTEKEQRSVWKRGQNIFKDSFGQPRAGILNMSRSVGENEETSGINPRSQIICYDLKKMSNKRNYLILASDGLWDVASPAQVAKRVDKLAKKGMGCDEIAKDLTRLAWKAGSEDNITATVINLGV